MKTPNPFFSIAAISCLAFLSACSDDSSAGSTLDGMSTYASLADLPKCEESVYDDRAFVEDEGLVYVCDAGTWRPLRPSESVERDTTVVRVSTCGDEEYVRSEKVCVDGGLLPLCNKSLEGSVEKNSKDASYTCRNGSWYKSSPIELVLEKTCSSANANDTVRYQFSNYVCKPDSIGWVYDFDNLVFGSLEYGDRVYKTVGIGSQMWMAENLDYRDSVAMPNLEGGRKCYQGSESMCEEYGSLYNWAAAMNLPKEYKDSLAGDLLKDVHQGICPDGWHVPGLDDWQTLKEFVIANNGSTAADDNTIKEGVGESLKDTTTWQESETSGKDRFGFAAKGAGVVTSGGTSREKNVFGIIHIAAEQPCGDKTFDDGRGCLNADSVAMDNLPIRADFRYDQTSLRFLQSKSYYRSDYMSVRCVMDEAKEESSAEETADESADK